MPIERTSCRHCEITIYLCFKLEAACRMFHFQSACTLTSKNVKVNEFKVFKYKIS